MVMSLRQAAILMVTVLRCSCNAQKFHSDQMLGPYLGACIKPSSADRTLNDMTPDECRLMCWNRRHSTCDAAIFSDQVRDNFRQYLQDGVSDKATPIPAVLATDANHPGTCYLFDGGVNATDWIRFMDDNYWTTNNWECGSYFATWYVARVRPLQKATIGWSPLVIGCRSDFFKSVNADNVDECKRKCENRKKRCDAMMFNVVDSMCHLFTTAANVRTSSFCSFTTHLHYAERRLTDISWYLVDTICKSTFD